MRKLFIRTDFEHLATIIWNDGKLTATDVSPHYRTSVQDWLRNGVFLGDKAVTPSDPMILESIKEDLKRFPEHKAQIWNY
jgi:hypothetical protein